MATVTLTNQQFQQLLAAAAAAGGARQAPKGGKHHHHKVVEEEWDDEPVTKKGGAAAAKKNKNKAKAKKVVKDDERCWAETRTEGEFCSKEAKHKDGLCGQHHAIVKRGEKLGPVEKELNPLCNGQTKKGKPCKNHAMDDENYCYQHLE